MTERELIDSYVGKFISHKDSIRETLNNFANDLKSIDYQAPDKSQIISENEVSERIAYCCRGTVCGHSDSIGKCSLKEYCMHKEFD